MIAIVTGTFRHFYETSREDKFFANSRWVFDFNKSCFGNRFDSYFIAFGAENIKTAEMDRIIDYFELHNVKRIYE